MQDKKLYLESLRGLAALSVALFHYNIGSFLNVPFIDNSWMMVDFFFVLSGYVIALNYGTKITGFQSLGVYQIKRFARLYPLHIFMLLAFLGLEFSKLIVIHFWIPQLSPPFQYGNQLSYLVDNIFLLQNFTLDDMSWNYPSWSISAEFYTYLIFGVWVLLFRKFPVVGFLVAAIIIGCSVFQILQNEMKSHEEGYYRCFYAFFLGSFIHKIESWKTFNLGSVVGFGALLTVIYAVSVAGYLTDTVLIFYPILFAVLIYILNQTRGSSWLLNGLQNKVLVYLGTISYGIYMIHALVWVLVDLVTDIVWGFKWGTLAPNDPLASLGNHPVSLVVVQLVGLIITILLAHISYQYIETPVKKFILRRLPQQKAV